MSKNNEDIEHIQSQAFYLWLKIICNISYIYLLLISINNCYTVHWDMACVIYVEYPILLCHVPLC